MTSYRAKHHVDHNQVAYEPDEIVRFTEEELAQFDASRTGPLAQLLAAGAIEGERPRTDLAPGEQSVEQLVAIARAMGLPVAEPLDRFELLASIGEARARLAAPVPSNTPPLPPVSGQVMTAEGPKLTPSEPLPELKASLTRAQIADIALAEAVQFADNATRAEIVAAIEAKRTTAAPAGSDQTPAA